MGGLWEADVKSFKRHFKRLAGSLKYSFEEFSTFLTRVEACLNSRPLCPLTDNSDCWMLLRQVIFKWWSLTVPTGIET